ncbi:hypothetical protein PRUPE_1G310600 [Prunus persica]|uniref:Uncharacterized protein n=1 Tax=Prunus persica TaxID=3760 RepID=A0A251R5T5_PRUPE|nr:hypothetical protein PRUPE_1G310600 [Prunus persica]
MISLFFIEKCVAEGGGELEREASDLEVYSLSVEFSVFFRASTNHDALFSPLGRFGCFCYGSRWLWLCIICSAKCCFLDLV